MSDIGTALEDPANSRIVPQNFWDLMTLSGSVAPASDDFAYTNTQDPDRSTMWQAGDATAQDVLGCMPGTEKITVSALGMGHHHCHGATARVRGYATNDGSGAASFDFTRPAYQLPITTGHDHGRAPNANLDTHDPLGLESEFQLYLTPVSGIGSVRWSFSTFGTDYGYDRLEVSRFYVGQFLEHSCNPSVGYVSGWEAFDTGSVSGAGSAIMTKGPRRRVCQMDFNKMSEADAAAYQVFLAQCQLSEDVMFSAFPGWGGAIQRNDQFIGMFAALDLIGRQVSWLTHRVQIKQN